MLKNSKNILIVFFLYFCFVNSKNSFIFVLENDLVLTFKNRLDYGYDNCSGQNCTSVGC